MRQDTSSRGEVADFPPPGFPAHGRRPLNYHVITLPVILRTIVDFLPRTEHTASPIGGSDDHYHHTSCSCNGIPDALRDDTMQGLNSALSEIKAY